LGGTTAGSQGGTTADGGGATVPLGLIFGNNTRSTSWSNSTGGSNYCRTFYIQKGPPMQET
jgi:hypothetical protein